MKTRIIQNEPAEPANGAQTVDATVAEPKRSNNVAARMGRWSASHKKTAIFGWLAFVAVAFMIGNASARSSSTRTRPAPASPATSTRCSPTIQAAHRATPS